MARCACCGRQTLDQYCIDCKPIKIDVLNQLKEKKQEKQKDVEKKPPQGKAHTKSSKVKFSKPKKTASKHTPVTQDLLDAINFDSKQLAQLVNTQSVKLPNCAMGLQVYSHLVIKDLIVLASAENKNRQIKLKNGSKSKFGTNTCLIDALFDVGAL